MFPESSCFCCRLCCHFFAFVSPICEAPKGACVVLVQWLYFIITRNNIGFFKQKQAENRPSRGPAQGSNRVKGYNHARQHYFKTFHKIYSAKKAQKIPINQCDFKHGLSQTLIIKKNKFGKKQFFRLKKYHSTKKFTHNKTDEKMQKSIIPGDHGIRKIRTKV